MSTQVAEAEFVKGGTIQPPSPLPEYVEQHALFEDGRRLSTARGIVTAIIISSPFWGLVVFVICLML